MSIAIEATVLTRAVTDAAYNGEGIIQSVFMLQIVFTLQQR